MQIKIMINVSNKYLKNYAIVAIYCYYQEREKQKTEILFLSIKLLHVPEVFAIKQNKQTTTKKVIFSP